jgi:hypothetical protein
MACHYLPFPPKLILVRAARGPQAAENVILEGGPCLHSSPGAPSRAGLPGGPWQEQAPEPSPGPARAGPADFTIPLPALGTDGPFQDQHAPDQAVPRFFMILPAFYQNLFTFWPHRDRLVPAAKLNMVPGREPGRPHGPRATRGRTGGSLPAEC